MTHRIYLRLSLGGLAICIYLVAKLLEILP